MYADDLILLSDSTNNVQKALDALLFYCVANGLVVNKEKQRFQNFEMVVN